MRFDNSPFLVIWETTQACDLACRHCRACAIPRRDPAELGPQEGLDLLDQIRALGDPLMIFTGGDPLKRPDIFELLAHSVELGLRTTITPSATPLLTEWAVRRMASVGVARMAISLDSSSADEHDRFRGVQGSFDRSLASLRWALKAGLETQINTTVTVHNLHDLDQIAALVAESEAKLWSVFFLVATGRASHKDDLTAEEYEQVFGYLYELSKAARFDIKTTEAQHYRRFVAQRRKFDGSGGTRPGIDLIARHGGINDGKGLVFISHTGEIFPSGFLPLSAGNVRRDLLAEVYQKHPLFLGLRRPEEFSGKCGVCEYRNICGGSRARAYAVGGDCFRSDPRCSYQPPAYTVPIITPKEVSA
ncbi:MAG: TIGR04053 family radical SAM/SPASM domain-containing protein [Bryobacterales bacterium]|nr:TIGR04053 family radical SAM/SPASM domain-containing protein [Bryobacterales bacterium]